jgi:cellulose synthase/poly-beta-1,6-N-acetylglucosamine synthase-like glycosyltransferase
MLTSQLTGFVATASCAVELDRPLRDREIPPSRSGCEYHRALVLVRLHEHPLGLVDVAVVHGRVRATDMAEAVLASLVPELEDHIDRHRCATAPEHAGNLLDAGLGPARGCDGSRRTATGELPPVALIVPTAGRPDDIRRCLISLVAVDYPQLEIVVVDNRPEEDATRHVVEQATAADSRIRYVGELLPGSSVARNRGLAETRSEIVVFTDDDVEVDPLWVRALIEPFLHDEQVQVVTGLVLPACYDTPQQQEFEEAAGFGKGFCRRVYDMGPNRPRKQMLYPYWGAPFGSGNNMAFRRRALLAIGGFDPALGAGSPALAGADIESFTHVVRDGGRLVYEPRAVVWHDHRRDEASLARQLSNYQVGSMAIMTKWLLRDMRVIPAVARAAGMLAGSALADAVGHPREAPRELSRLRGQRGLSGEQYGRRRQLRSFTSGPWLYLRSRRWARQHRLAAVLDGATAAARTRGFVESGSLAGVSVNPGGGYQR